MCVCMLTINLQLVGRGRGWRGLLCVYGVYQPATRGPWTGLERTMPVSVYCVCVCMVFMNLQLAGRGWGWRGLLCVCVYGVYEPATRGPWTGLERTMPVSVYCVCVCMLFINLQLAGRGRGWRGLGLGLLCVCVCADYQPATRGPWTGLERTMPVSVIPYLSSNRCPVICSHRSITGWGSADEPLTISLQERKEMFI